jgi:vitamin B12 transporter
MKRLAACFGFCMPLFCAGQADTIRQLETVDITSNRFDDFANEGLVQRIDSISLIKYNCASIADLLKDESGIFIKSYGLGSSATTSARGGSAAHSNIVWNGFSLTNPMLGLTDLSLVPAGFFNGINIRYGNNCALAGSGAIGATVELNNNPVFRNEMVASASVTLASFATVKEQILVRKSTEKNSASFTFFYEQAKNNFEFTNRAEFNTPLQKQTNNEVKQYGFIVNESWRVNKRQLLILNGWYQNSNREIPPTMTTAESIAYQTDNVLRITGEWQYYFKNNNLKFRSAWFDESIRYVDENINLNSFGNSKSIIAEGEGNFSFREWGKLNAGISNSYVTATVDEYKQSRYQNKAAVFVSYSITDKQKIVAVSTSARQEFIDGSTTPFTYQIQSSVKILSGLALRASYSKVYRAPSLNDKYWVPGGNKDLKPEDGYTAEAGLSFERKNNAFSVSAQTTFYTQQITNWIIWLPGSGGYWTPQNIYKVWSRGNETQLKVSYTKNKFSITPQIISAYTLSTNETENISEDSQNKQLIYVPRINWTGGVNIKYNHSLLSYTHGYKSRRYTSSDNLYFLGQYQYATLFISQSFALKQNLISAEFSIHNLWDENYESIAWRPMPRRNYSLTLKYQFTHSK